MRGGICRLACGFNPRTRVGCDRGRWPFSPSRYQFQSTHPRGVRLLVVIALIHFIYGFNPRTRVGCDRCPGRADAGPGWFQSTHPRGVRPARRMAWPMAMGVSIHAPAWGATLGRCLVILGEQVSIHAPAWGATRRRDAHFDARLSSFNPRTRVGCDVILGEQQRRRGLVSIHAPAWGATGPDKGGPAMMVVSIHAPAWGATPCWQSQYAPPCKFQSTHPRGVRHNFRICAGRMLYVSIHAPAWGATSFRLASPLASALFQSTHPRGVRLFPCFIQ